MEVEWGTEIGKREVEVVDHMIIEESTTTLQNTILGSQ
jgi:hypothetical protein